MNTRRNVLRWIALGAGAVAGLVPGLGRNRKVLAQDTAAEPEFQSIGKLSDLQDGQLLVEEGFEPGPVLVIEKPATEMAEGEADEGDDTEGEAAEMAGPELIALNPTCPHRDCLVDWDGSEFICPCHDSRFDIEGKVTKGPARTDLPVYTVKIEDDEIMVAEPVDA